MTIDVKSAACRRVKRGAAIAAIAVVSSGLAHAADVPLPVADFVKRAQFIEPRLSPDGKHLVVSQIFDKDGRDKRYMVVYDLVNMKVVSTIGMPFFEVPAGYRWITNSRIAVSVGLELGSLERPEFTGEVLTMNLDGGAQEYVYGYQMFSRSKRGGTMADDEGEGRVAYVPKELNGHFLLTENLWSRSARTSRIYDIDATTAARRLVTEIGRPGFRFLMQDDGKPRFASGWEEDYSYAVCRFDDATHAWQELPSEDKKNELLPWTILPGNKELVASVSIDGGPRRVVKQSLVDGSRVILAESNVGSIDQIEFGPRPYLPLVATSSVDIPKPIYIDQTSFEAKLYRTLSEQFVGSYVHFINFADDGKLLFSVRSDRDPGAFYLFDKAAGKASFLFAEMPWIEPEKMADQRPISFKARDGREIHGYLTLPPNRGDGKMPMVLLPHGGPHGIADEWFFDTDAQFLASRGYAVLQVNYRGSGGRGPAFEGAGYHQWGGKIQDDLVDGVKWAISNGVADEARICAYGGSFGAYSAMMVTVREPTMFKCAVGYSGVYDLAQMYEENATRRSKFLYNYLVKAVGEDPAELARFSPTRNADKIKVPVLLVHGSRDTRTPPLQAETMRDALTKAGNAPQWMFVDQEGHGFYASKNRQAFYERLEKFLAAYLKN